MERRQAILCILSRSTRPVFFAKASPTLHPIILIDTTANGLRVSKERRLRTQAIYVRAQLWNPAILNVEVGNHLGLQL
jgi:hypothetical protein